MSDFDAERIAAEEGRKAAQDEAVPTPADALWLSEDDYMELEAFMKDLIDWADSPAHVGEIRERAYRYFHRLALHRHPQQ